MNDRDEWRADVAAMTELERQLSIDEPRRAIGIIGDKEDDQC